MLVVPNKTVEQHPRECQIDPTSIDKELEQNPSNVFLQLMAAASMASLETDRLTQKLSDETKASVLDKDINFATASRAEL